VGTKKASWDHSQEARLFDLSSKRFLEVHPFCIAVPIFLPATYARIQQAKEWQAVQGVALRALVARGEGLV